jgi:hypothetical protein
MDHEEQGFPACDAQHVIVDLGEGKGRVRIIGRANELEYNSLKKRRDEIIK